MLNPSPDIGIDFIFESTPWVDVLVTTTAKPPLLSATTLPPPSIPIISHVQQTPSPSPANVPSSSLQDLPNFGSLLQDEAQAKNEDFLNKLDENIQKIIKEQVKEQVKVQVSKIFPKIEKTVNELLKAEVLTRSSNSSRTSHAVAADLSELELKKILIDKIERNKSIHISDEQKNIYKALVDAYECEKLILYTYGDTVTLKRRRDDEDKDEESFAGSNRRSKRRREGKEPESTSAPKEKTSKTSDKSIEGSKSHHKTASESAPAEEPMHTTQYLEEPAPQEFKTGETGDQLVEEASQESARDVYSKHKIIAVTELQIIEWHNYKHLDWNTVRRADDKLYKLKEGDFKRLRIQDIEDMLLLLVQGKLTNLIVDEHFAFNVSLRLFTRSIIIQRRVKDLQLGVESYQMKLNLIKPDTDGTLNNVQTDLDDRLKGIWMQYLPQTIWKRSDKDRAVAMIQAIDKQLKTRRIMRSLEKFVEPEGSTQGYALVSVEVLRYDTEGVKAIVIYNTKVHVAHDSIVRVVRQGAKVA
nr:hypothetical protein [Tanacetum cinerariifolium]